MTPPRAAMDGARFLPGQVLAERYRMIGLLGKGGMGEVYRADDLKLGQPVALKFLPRDVERDPERLDRFLAEVRLSLRVTHPNVCRVFDIGDIDDRHFLSMEYVDGEDLASLLRRIGRLPEDKAVEIARQLCAGLAAAHDAGVLHRDLKPSNVMIDGRGRARITDFGLASATSGVAGREARVGTPQYMAPEQFEGGELTVRTDMYALGLVLYELFTGKRAFDGHDILAMATERTSAPTSPSAHVSGLNPIIERAILRCLEPDPANRPASAAGLAAALPGGDPLAIAVAAGETPSPEMVARSGGRGELRPAVAVGCLAVVLAGLALAWYWHGRTDLQNRVPLPKPPAELRGLARAAITAAGYTSLPAHSISGFARDAQYLRHVERTDQSPGRWRQLATVTPAPIWFFYREAPQAMSPMSVAGVFSSTNPPMVAPGMLRVRLDPAGRMHEFVAVPPEAAPSGATSAEPDWTPLFTVAGQSQAEWTAVDPSWAPPHASDVRRAWTRGDLRIEAAAFLGRPVWFRVIPPWRTPAEVRITEVNTEDRARDWLFQGVLVAMIAGGVLLARRNVRQGRSDRRSATRLVLVFVSLGLVAVVMRIGGDPASWMRLFQNNLGAQLYVAGLVWVFYVAIEPYIRRLWPGTLVAWTRALEGRLRDPMVGRHILLGALAGMAFEALFQTQELLGLFGGTTAVPTGNIAPLESGRERIASIAEALQTSFLIPVGALIFVLICRVVFRRPWLAYLVAVAFGTIFTSLGERWPLLIVGILASTLLLVVLTRLGLFALCVAIIFSYWDTFGLTTSADSWFFPESALTMLAFAALAVYGFWVSLGGQKIFSDGLLER
jgi:predicted Ser/Thr protein kinase